MRENRPASYLMQFNLMRLRSFFDLFSGLGNSGMRNPGYGSDIQLRQGRFASEHSPVQNIAYMAEAFGNDTPMART